MIILNNVSKSTPEKVLFENLSIAFNRGDRVGIIGPNGCGKSTLLRIIVGAESVDSGSIDRAQEQIFLAPQHIEAPPAATINDYLEPGEYPEVWRLLSELNLIDIPLDTPIDQLSGGQKTKLLLIKTFSAPSTTLLLDEPTNHLDIETRQWLVGEVLSYNGIIVMISHDRAFLNLCSTKVLEIDSSNHETSIVHGNYDVYKTEKAAWIKRKREEYSLQQRKKKEMLEWIALKRQEATVYPSPARGRQLRQMEHRLEREILVSEVAKPKKEVSMRSKDFLGDVHNGKLMLRLRDVTRSFGDHTVLNGVSFELRGKSRARLTGENGSGKTTLLEMITGNLQPDSGSVEVGENIRIGYFTQELESLNESASVMETIINIPHYPIPESRARSILGSFLFSGDSITKKVRNLSYGERVRLQLAVLLQQEHELLILDEPTNHLDIASREIIESALQKYEGALLVVSHDEYFLRSIGIDEEIILRKEKGI
jgi:ATPase subunit of ABC transporter with duplicated ATPase domains